ncbi:hypothetical protein PF005_g12251 [Phytophthora fragariae]|uniref:Uncharacterized protein n=1 Tax=Phytophthora fragariae TaxID=53985 RepID=A0A6A3XWG9_9STRA|nr:hypothetical protein PF005_g12251 [Phytophthora fragariae]
MSTKSGISFLLNPQSSDEMGLTVTAPASPPPPTFQRLMAMAQSPDAEATSSLLLLGSCIAPLEKVNACKKTVVPVLSLAALCEASSGSSYSSSVDSDDEDIEELPTVETKVRAVAKSKPKAKPARKRVRKSRTPPCKVEGVSEKLRSKHVRTLELLQKTLDENVELRERAAKLRKGTLHLGQGLPRSNLSSELEDEIERLKEEHTRKLKEVEEAASAKLAEQVHAAESLVTANNKLKNDMITMDVALRDARGRLKYERQTWNGERAQLEATVREATKTQPPASPSRVKRNQPQTEALVEEEKSNQRLEAELELSRQACSNADAARRSAETRLVDVKNDFERACKEVAAQREQIVTLQAQLAASQAQQKSMFDELKTVRERNRTLEAKSPKERPSSTASAKLQLQQMTLLAKLQDTEERFAKLEMDHRALQSQTARLQQQLANEVAQRRADAADSGIFAIHVELKRENFQLRAQVEELKALQKRFLTSAKKKTMSFPCL